MFLAAFVFGALLWLEGGQTPPKPVKLTKSALVKAINEGGSQLSGDINKLPIGK